jgi:hypothetical protein
MADPGKRQQFEAVTYSCRFAAGNIAAQHFPAIEFYSSD